MYGPQILREFHMSRGLAIFLFWVLGFSIGSVGYLLVPNLVSWLGIVLPEIVVNQAILGAILAGVVGSAVSTFTVVTWANKSS
jgi:hypothetical protein